MPMGIAGIETRAAEIGVLQEAIKEYGMLYQADLKERCARWLGMPFDEFYHLPYGQWADVRVYCRNNGGLANY